MKKSTYFWVKRRTRTENWKVPISRFARISVIKLVEDTKRRGSSFMTYVKQSLSVNSSMFTNDVRYLPRRFAVPDF